MARSKEFDPDVAVERAMEEFWRKGYASTTPQDLVDALCIGKGSLYNAFGSKHGLFEQALRRYRDTQVAALVRMVDEPGSVKERLRRVLEFVAEVDRAIPERWGCLAVNTAAERGRIDDAARGFVRTMFDHSEEALRTLVQEGQRTGEIGQSHDADDTASMLVNTILGLRILAQVDDGPQRRLRVVDATVNSL